MLRKLVSSVLSCVLLISLTSSVYANEHHALSSIGGLQQSQSLESNTGTIVYTQTIPAEAVEADIQRQLRSFLATQPMSRMGEYRTVTVRSELRMTPTLRAGNQTPSGSRFPTGGSFHWSPGGFNATVSIGGSWGPTSASVSLGTTGSFGYVINVPRQLWSDTRGALLYIQNRVRVTEIRIERRDHHTQPWQHFQTFTPTSIDQRTFFVRAAS